MKTSSVLALAGAAALALDGASAFTVSSGVGALPSVSLRKVSHQSSTSIKMGFFDAIGKAMADSMSNDENLGKKQNPGFRDGYEGPRPATVKFSTGQEVTSYAGERLGDVCRKAGVSVMYGCQKGTCGTCEVMLVNEQGGQSEKVRVCEAIVPKNAPGDGPMEYKIELSDSKVALKRQLDWEQVKDRK